MSLQFVKWCQYKSQKNKISFIYKAGRTVEFHMGLFRRSLGKASMRQRPFTGPVGMEVHYRPLKFADKPDLEAPAK